jgi:hypothetical protein
MLNPSEVRLMLWRLVISLGVLFTLGAFGFQTSFRQFPYLEDDPAPVPPDAFEKTEWAFARLMYPSVQYGRWGRDSWPTDYPKADRQFVQGVRRLTRIHTRSSEQVVDLDSDEVFNWPWIYAVEVGHWSLTDAQCMTLREYLLRGGFLMVGRLPWHLGVGRIHGQHESGFSGPSRRGD